METLDTTTPSRQRFMPRRMVRTRDGVELCTDVYLPETPGAVPTLMVRTPYGRTLPFLLRMALRLNRAGLGVVLQDSRGRYQSDGSYDWRREEDDGWDTLQWIGDQEWANGRVGLLGLSISAHPNFKLAAAEPPPGIDVGAMVSVMGAVDFHSMFFRDGALLLHWALPWCTMMGTRGGTRNAWATRPWKELFWHLPLAEIEEHPQFDMRFWRIVVSNPAAGGFWEDLDAIPALPSIDVPTLHLSGWYDFMLHHTLRGYRGMLEGPAAERQKLVVGPWDHESLFSSFTGAGGRGELDLMELVTSWLIRWLADGPEAEAAAADLGDDPVDLYVVEGDRWLVGRRFPLPEARQHDLYLTSGGGANGAGGDGRLLAEAPAAAGRDHFTYDPAAPVGTRGGALWPFRAVAMVPGPAAQNDVEEREDVLVYTSEPLAEDLVVVGPVEAELWVATSARDTDFTAKLVDLDRHGVPRIVQDGILRGRFHRSLREPALLDANTPYRFRIDLGSTAHRFRRGHRLRLEVSSSNFPKFDRNVNSAAALYTVPRGTVAQQTVLHGGPTPSRLRLSVLDAAAVESLTAAGRRPWEKAGEDGGTESGTESATP